MWGSPVVQVAQPYGQAGPGKLFVQGNVPTGTPVGSQAQIDFWDHNATGALLLGSTTVTRKDTDPVPFTTGQAPQIFSTPLAPLMTSTM
jgi:hypothetical protein